LWLVVSWLVVATVRIVRRILTAPPS
jgi:hypothetical protein